MAAGTVEERQTVQAVAKFVRVSPRKARLVADHIRGRSVPEARTILAFTERAAAVDVEKVLRSAVANAESRPDLHWTGDELVISAAYADEGPTLKRWRARARGRVARIRKRTCHITIELAQGAPAVGISHVPAMAAPEPEPEPEVVEEPEAEATEEPEAAETEAVEEETTEEPEAVEPEAVEEETTEEPEESEETDAAEESDN